jgi:hypothetical protein
MRLTYYCYASATLLLQHGAQWQTQHCSMHHISLALTTLSATAVAAAAMEVPIAVALQVAVLDCHGPVTALVV